jgi:ABC-type multidrug transport system fused ATPase/permease subunit
MLVTNQLQYARPADKIIYMSEGRVVEAGTYDELMERGGGFAQLMQQTEVRAHYFVRSIPIYGNFLSHAML